MLTTFYEKKVKKQCENLKYLFIALKNPQSFEIDISYRKKKQKKVVLKFSGDFKYL